MIKSVFSFFGIFIFISSLYAQTTSIEKDKVMQFFQNQQFEEAIEYLMPAAATSDSDNLQLLNYLGYANYMSDNTREAEKYYERMVSIDSNNLTANQYLAILNNNPRPDKAQIFVQRLINLVPNKAGYYRNMGDLLRRKNERDSALLYYDKAYALAPNDVKVMIGLADILIDLKGYVRADSILTKGLARDSLNVSFLKLKIRYAYEAQEYQKAITAGERLMVLEEASLTALTQLSLCYYNLKMYVECIRVCEYMRSMDIGGESVCYYEARACAKLKDYDKSNKLLLFCLYLATSKAVESYYYDLADNYESMGHYKMAIYNLDTAYYLFKDPVMLYNCGRIAETGLKDNKLAHKYFQRYLSVAHPQTDAEKKAYAYLKRRWVSKARNK